MEVIGAGFPRTGTMSLKSALETLGFGPCYHMREVLAAHPGTDHTSLWTNAARGMPIDWRALFQGYRATVDMPSAAFYRELLAVHPDARVLLSVRDPERWYASVRETLYALSKVRDPGTEAFTQMVDEVFWSGLLHGRFEDKAYAIGVYEQHIETVKRTVRPDRLLVFDVKEGWEPLCQFLGVPTPAIAFPHVNDSEIFTDYLRLRSLVGDADAATPGDGPGDYEQRIHERMLAFERQLLDEIRSAWREASPPEPKP